MNRDNVLQAVARGWCHEDTAHKELDGVLAEAIADEVMLALKSQLEKAREGVPEEPIRWRMGKTVRDNRPHMSVAGRQPDMVDLDTWVKTVDYDALRAKLEAVTEKVSAANAEDAVRYAMLFRDTWRNGNGIGVFAYIKYPGAFTRLSIQEANEYLDAEIRRKG